MRPLSRVDAVPAFAAVQEELIGLLEGLTEAEWGAPTSSTSWTVRDVAAHLLDGDVRRLSLHRDGLVLADGPGPAADYETLVAYLDRLNDEWIRAARRMSPRLLIELTAFTTPRVVEHFRALDPDGRARFPVAWAGEETSRNWLDVAREYTEKWHHQQQIREAIGRPLLTDRRWLRPLLDTLVLAVPPLFDREAPDAGSARVLVEVGGVVDRRWLLDESAGSWELFAADDEEPAAGTRIAMDDDTAWRLFTKRIDEDEALDRMGVEGDREIAAVLARAVGYMK